MSFLPGQFAHPYEINPSYRTSVAYFSMECGIDLFNDLVHFTQDLPKAAVLVGYELALSKLLKDAALNFSTSGGWICEFAKDGENAFVLPPAAPDATEAECDRHDGEALHHILEDKIHIVHPTSLPTDSAPNRRSTFVAEGLPLPFLRARTIP